MTRSGLVLVPLDGSLQAQGILPFVVDLAGPADMGVVVLRVVPPVVPEVPLIGARPSPTDLAITMSEAQEYLDPIAADLRRRGIRAQSRVRCGFAVDEILAATREAAPDFIAMTTHGRSGFKRLLFGSVAEDVLRKADVPVLLARLDARGAARRSARDAVAA